MAIARRIIKRMDSLPPLPGVVARVLELSSDSDVSMDKLAKVVVMDPGITTQVLRMANSSFFGLRYKASSLHEALPKIGINNLVQIALGSGVGSFFTGEQVGYKLSRGQLWRHSMAAALISSRLGRKYNIPDVPVIFTAALLHDIGKLLLSEFVTDEYQKIEELVESAGWTLVDAEKEVLKVDHATIGAAAAKKWNLSRPIMTAVAYHHRPAKTPKPKHITNAVAMADYLANICGAPSGLGGEARTPPASAIWELSIYPKQRDELRNEMTELLEKAEELLEMAW